MKNRILLFTLIVNLITLNGNAQCEETYSLCIKQFTKAELGQGWATNKQSIGTEVEKGKEFETEVTTYKGLEYRLSACTDVGGGTAVKFKVEQDEMVTTQDAAGNTVIEKQRKVIFDNTVDNPEFYVIFRSNKTEKFYITVYVPGAGSSKNRKLEDPNHVCLGILLEERRVTKSSL